MISRLSREKIINISTGNRGVDSMIMIARTFLQTAIVDIIFGLIGYGIGMLMRLAEYYLIPWKGKR